MPSIAGLATSAAFTAAKSKIPKVNLVKKTDYDAKNTSHWKWIYHYSWLL